MYIHTYVRNVGPWRYVKKKKNPLPPPQKNLSFCSPQCSVYVFGDASLKGRGSRVDQIVI